MIESSALVVTAEEFANTYIARSVATAEQARHWLGVMAGEQGTRASMAATTPQARLDAYCDALQSGDMVVWHTDAAALAHVLTGWDEADPAGSHVLRAAAEDDA